MFSHTKEMKQKLFMLRQCRFISFHLKHQILFLRNNIFKITFLAEFPGVIASFSFNIFLSVKYMHT